LGIDDNPFELEVPNFHNQQVDLGSLIFGTTACGQESLGPMKKGQSVPICGFNHCQKILSGWDHLPN